MKGKLLECVRKQVLSALRHDARGVRNIGERCELLERITSGNHCTEGASSRSVAERFFGETAVESCRFLTGSMGALLCSCVAGLPSMKAFRR